MTELEQYIQSYFGVVTRQDMETIVSMFEYKLLKKGEFLLQSHNRSDKLAFVQSGLLRVFAQTEDKEVTQWISSKGYFAVDISSFMFNNPSRWNIQALVDTEVYYISISNYQKLGTLVPTWNELEKLFIVRCSIMMEDRIFAHLSMSAEERYALFFEKNKELFNRVPLQYIASMLGMTPETFSRIRKKQLS